MSNVVKRLRDLPSVVQTGTLLIFLVTISSITSRTVASILHLKTFSYVPIRRLPSGLRNLSVSSTFIAINLRILYWVMTETTMVLADSES